MNATTVTATEWGISYNYSDPSDVTLNVHRCDEDAPNAWGGRGVVIRHPEYHGRKFASVEAAQEFALAVGLLKVYEPKQHSAQELADLEATIAPLEDLL